MDSAKLLSDIAMYRTYSKVLPNGKKETWEQIVERYGQMLFERFPHLIDETAKGLKFIRERKIVPSMRALQFAGEPIYRESLRSYNCSFLTIDSFKSFADMLYISMCGTGVGYSVKSCHTAKLPKIQYGHYTTYVIQDSREGWADAVTQLLKNPRTEFFYDALRPKGSPLSTGGTSSGPEPLRDSIEKIRTILLQATDRQLRPFEVHRIVCLLADAVVVGGVRRSACIVFFDDDDREMLECKSGNWWEKYPEFARANNSVQLHRSASYDQFSSVMDACFASNAGEPGISWTNDLTYSTGYNPCHEISLKSKGLCNLTEINMSDVAGSHDYEMRAYWATYFGTLQASFTNFNYVDSLWQQNAQEEALLGVSMTGLGHNWNTVNRFIKNGTMKKVASLMKIHNASIAQLIGINPAKRIGAIKPSGTTSTVLSTTSGIHAAHDNYYIRRIRVDKTNPVGMYLGQQLKNTPFLETDLFSPDNWVVSVPIHMSDAIIRDQERAVDTMNRAKLVAQNWINPSHNEGINTHNVSLTVNYKPGEEVAVKQWMWENREHYAGISLLPFDGGTYQQAPFESISSFTFQALLRDLPSIDLSNVVYDLIDGDQRQGEIACGGGSCEIK